MTRTVGNERVVCVKFLDQAADLELYVDPLTSHEELISTVGLSSISRSCGDAKLVTL